MKINQFSFNLVNKDYFFILLSKKYIITKIARYDVMLNQLWWSKPKGKRQLPIWATNTIHKRATLMTHIKNKPTKNHHSFLCRTPVVAEIYAAQKLITPKPRQSYESLIPLPFPARSTYSLSRKVSMSKTLSNILEPCMSEERSHPAMSIYFSRKGL